MVLALSACGSSTATSVNDAGTARSNGLGTPAVDVNETDSLKFVEASATVKLGDTVQWTDAGAVPHDVTFDANPELTSPMMAQHDTWQVKFSKPGTYPYHCSIHPGMDGTVTVT